MDTIEFWTVFNCSFSVLTSLMKSLSSGPLAGTSPGFNSCKGWRKIVEFSDLVAAATELATAFALSSVLFVSSRSSSTIFSKVSRFGASSASLALDSSDFDGSVASVGLKSSPLFNLNYFLEKYDSMMILFWNLRILFILGDCKYFKIIQLSGEIDYASTEIID